VDTNVIFFRRKSIDGAATRDLAPLLRRIIFIGKAALRLRLDDQRIGLSAPDSGDQFVVGVLDGGKASRPLRDIFDRRRVAGGEDFGARLAFVSADAACDRRLSKNSLKCGARHAEGGALHT
jgi:hypothetical protein